MKGRLKDRLDYRDIDCNDYPKVQLSNSYKLKEAESLWLEPLGDKTMELHCDYCDGDAFQVYFEGVNLLYV